MSVETGRQDDQEIIVALAALSLIEYDRVRKEKAEEMGIRTTTLDMLVTQARPDAEPETESENIVEDIEPWSEPVNGLDLVNHIATALSRHMILPPGAATVIPLWVIGSYCMDVWRVWPKLLVTSPRMRCGKSTLLEIIEAVICRPLLVSNITAPAVFRCIEKYQVSILMDEADTFTKDNDELNGIINAGHTKRTATVIRVEKVNGKFEPRRFSVWGPQVISGIGEHRQTLHDRSIHIELQRKLTTETVLRFPDKFFEAMHPVRRMCFRWAKDNQEALINSTIIPPVCGNDRAQDNWKSIFAIAEIIGGEWLEDVKRAYAIFTEPDTESDDPGIMLLSDIKQVFKDQKTEKLPSTMLVNKLVEMEDRPWFEWKRGKPLTQNSLSRLLRPYHIISGTIRISSTCTLKGYRLFSFQSAFGRYLTEPAQNTPNQSVTTSQPTQDGPLSQNQSVTLPPMLRFQNR